MRTKALLALALAVAAVPGMAQEHLKSLDGKGLDPNISPKEDFYGHVNSKWMKDHPLSPEYSRYGQFNILNDSSNNRVQRLVMGLAATNPAKGTNAYKIANIYELAMDSVRRNREGAAPIKADLAKIENTKPEDMENLLIWIHRNYGSPFFNAAPQEDLGNSNIYAMYVGSTGLGLGDRDYYLLKDKKHKDILNAYDKLIQTDMKLAGYSAKDAKRIAKNVIKIETLLADSTWTREQSRNIPAMYNIRTMAQLKEMYPNIPWNRWFKETMNIDAPETVIVTEINTVKQADKLIKTLSDREKKDYYLWEYVSGAARYLSDDFANASFEFNKVMSGVQQQRPRWKKALGAVEGVMGEGIGQLYVEKYFPESSKEYMLQLVENLRNALGKHIINLSWMSDDTKVQAMKKLNAFTVKIGYPDSWRDYSKLDVDTAQSYWANIKNAILFNQEYNLADYGKPVDRTRWHMSPQTVNAYYNPTTNEICFPAGILQPPFFDFNADDAVNYGAIGVVIGHEMTHGFDDQGRQFDKNGNFADWWTPADAEAFNALADKLVAQFDNIIVADSTHANGRLTLGENIADQGGLRVAYTAYKNSLNGAEAPVIDGLTPDQRFYLAYANVWAANITKDEIMQRTTNDPHSLGRWRVNATLRNIQPFYEAFGIEEGDPMFMPEAERVIIW